MAILFIDGKLCKEPCQIHEESGVSAFDSSVTMYKDRTGKCRTYTAKFDDRTVKLYNGFMRLRRGEVAYYFSTKR